MLHPYVPEELQGSVPVLLLLQPYISGPKAYKVHTEVKEAARLSAMRRSVSLWAGIRGTVSSAATCTCQMGCSRIRRFNLDFD